MKKLLCAVLCAALLAGMCMTASASAPFGEPEKVALVISGSEICKGRGFLGSFTYITEAEADSMAASASGESTYRLGLGDSFTETVTYSAFENHGEPVWQWRRVCGLDLTLMAQALGIDTSKEMSVSVSSADGMSKTLTDAFGVKTKRYTFGTDGKPASVVSPVLVLFETQSETSTRGAGEYPAMPEIGADSPDRVNFVFGYGQTQTDEITSCFWVKDVSRLRYGSEAPALTVRSGDGKKTSLPLSILVSRGVWTAELGTVRASGLPLEEVLGCAGVSVPQGRALRAVGAGGESTEIPAGDIASVFAAWQATDGGAAVENGTALCLYLKDGTRLGGLESLEVVQSSAAAPEKPAFSDMAGYEWAADAVSYLRERGVVSGVSETEFAPAANIKRGDFILMLVRAFDFKATDGGCFEDVAQDSYYYNAVSAAKSLGIARGDGERFSPESAITRQEAMTLLHRALECAGVTLPSGSLEGFSDAASVADWAADSVGALAQAGIITGSGGKIAPQGLMRRAEMAAALSRALKL